MNGASKLSQDDLRSSQTPWVRPANCLHDQRQGSFRSDVLIVGAGITGALLAERLTRDGYDVVIVDREDPTQGSTLASTSMLLWDIDRSLGELVDFYGFERAARAYHASLAAARGLTALVLEHGISCAFRRRNALYLANDEGADKLVSEAALRDRAGLPTAFLTHGALLERFGIGRAGAILSPEAAEADPAALAVALLNIAIARGARLRKGEALAFDSHPSKVMIGFDNGLEAEAKHVVLATGYAMPPLVRATVQEVSSSFAIATSPQSDRLWPEGALIWESGENYHYARTTVDGRVIFGGEDDRTLIKSEERNAAIPAKSLKLMRELRTLWPQTVPTIDYRWSGTFDSTRDGLPLIGPVDGARRICAAYGYGGNGITFSFLAAHLIGMYLAGGTSPLFEDFAIGRDAP